MEQQQRRIVGVHVKHGAGQPSHRRRLGRKPAQQQAQQMAQGFAAGQENVNLQDVMVNLQKASLSFQQMVQVRNKLMSAFDDIIKMQV